MVDRDVWNALAMHMLVSVRERQCKRIAKAVMPGIFCVGDIWNWSGISSLTRSSIISSFVNLNTSRQYVSSKIGCESGSTRLYLRRAIIGFTRSKTFISSILTILMKYIVCCADADRQCVSLIAVLCRIVSCRHANDAGGQTAWTRAGK